MCRDFQHWVKVAVGRDGAWSWRVFPRLVRSGAAGRGGLSLRDRLTVHAGQVKKQQKACILLWMAGGPSQFETFDPKPGAETQGPTRAIPTAVPGIHIAEHWKHTARATREMAAVRSMTSRASNHGPATDL